MSRENFETAMQLIEANKDQTFGISPQTDEKIIEAEIILSVELPDSYKKFLKKVGDLALGSQDVFGLRANVMIEMTIYERKSYEDPSFPLSFVPIHELGNGEKSCLDTSKMNDAGECPVIAWYFGRVEKLAEDFGQFLLEKVTWGLESLEEDGEKINWLGLR